MNWFAKNLTGSLMIALLLVGGCEQENLSERALILEDETIAVVNSKKLHLKDFQKRLQVFIESYGIPIQKGDKKLSQIKDIVINQMIEEEVLIQEAARKGVMITEKELQSEVEAALSPYPQAGFERLLQQKGKSREEWVERLEFTLLTKKLINQEVTPNIPVTKREIRSYYKENRKSLIQPRAIRVMNLTISNQSEAKSLRKMIRRGKRFDDLVQKYSISPDRDAGGDLGFIERGELPLEMENAIFNLSWKNRVSKVVHSQDGFHIFYYMKYRPQKRLKLNAATPLIKEKLIKSKENEAYQAWLGQLKSRATIQIDQKMLQSEEGF